MTWRTAAGSLAVIAALSTAACGGDGPVSDTEAGVADAATSPAPVAGTVGVQPSAPPAVVPDPGSAQAAPSEGAATDSVATTDPATGAATATGVAMGASDASAATGAPAATDASAMAGVPAVGAPVATDASAAAAFSAPTGVAAAAGTATAAGTAAATQATPTGTATPDASTPPAASPTAAAPTTVAASPTAASPAAESPAAPAPAAPAPAAPAPQAAAPAAAEPSPTPSRTSTPGDTSSGASTGDAGGGQGIGAIRRGEGTYHVGTDGSGACEYPATPDNLMVAAINGPEWEGSAACGTFARVTGPEGTVTVRIVDYCPECKPGDIDFSVEAFARIATAPPGRIPITWQIVAGDVDGPIRLRYREGSSTSWVAIQVRNHRLPITKLEVMPTGASTWQAVPRQSWNYFVVEGRVTSGPIRVRVTALDGQTLDEIMPSPEGGLEVSGRGQF